VPSAPARRPNAASSWAIARSQETFTAGSGMALAGVGDAAGCWNRDCREGDKRPLGRWSSYDGLFGA
jgi:hypothetical protein